MSLYIDLLDSKYPKWRDACSDTYDTIGMNGDIQYLQMIESTCVVLIPYNKVALGATITGNLDTLSYALSKGRFPDTMGIRLMSRAHLYGHTSLYECIAIYFGSNVYDIIQ